MDLPELEERRKSERLISIVLKRWLILLPRHSDKRYRLTSLDAERKVFENGCIGAGRVVKINPDKVNIALEFRKRVTVAAARINRRLAFNHFEYFKGCATAIGESSYTGTHISKRKGAAGRKNMNQSKE